MYLSITADSWAAQGQVLFCSEIRAWACCREHPFETEQEQRERINANSSFFSDLFSCSFAENSLSKKKGKFGSWGV